MSVVRALASFGVQATLDGPPPGNDEDYRSRVIIREGIRPPWPEVKRKIFAQHLADCRVEIATTFDRISAHEGASSAHEEKVNLMRACEARALIHDQKPDPDTYPLLALEARTSGKAVSECANEVLQSHRSHSKWLAMIETHRLAFHERLENVRSETDMTSLVNDLAACEETLAERY